MMLNIGNCAPKNWTRIVHVLAAGLDCSQGASLSTFHFVKLGRYLFCNEYNRNFNFIRSLLKFALLTLKIKLCLYREWLTEHEAELVQRFDPSSPVDTIGFFIAKFNVGERQV